MSEAPTLRFARLVDLSRPLRPGENHHPWLRYEVRVDSIVNSFVTNPDDVPPEGQWYVVSQLHLSGHAGTHVEAPFHAVAGGASIGDLAVERFFGQTAILDLSDVAWSAPFNLARLHDAATEAGDVRSGDIVFLRFDWDRRAPREGGQPPYPTPEALRWLVDQGIKLLGIDSPGLEVPGNRALPNHGILFNAGIPLIESLTRLDELRARRVFVAAQPLPAYGADAIPLRVLAFEGVPPDG